MIMINFIIPLIIAAGVLAWVLRPGKSPITARKVAILATAIPPVVVAIAVGKTWVSDISNTCFIVGLGLIGAAILASAGFAFARKGGIAKGIGFGICIAVIVSIVEFGLLKWLRGV